MKKLFIACLLSLALLQSSATSIAPLPVHHAIEHTAHGPNWQPCVYVEPDECEDI